jgi:hypothetical protein
MVTGAGQAAIRLMVIILWPSPLYTVSYIGYSVYQRHLSILNPLHCLI